MTTETDPNVVTVSSLICHRDVPMALKCLGSMQSKCQESIQFILHDDGSLQDEDVALLTESLRSPTIIKKQESDERMADVLHKYPFSSAFRASNIFAKKLFDPIFFNNSDNFAYCDTDVYFFRPFLNPFVLPDKNVYALFLKDPIHPYSIRVRDFSSSNLKPIQHVNAGMVCFRRSYYDLDFVEWLLSQEIIYSKPYLIEQTIWAALGQKVSCRLWDASQMVFMTPSVRPNETMVAGHFVSPSRYLLQQYMEEKMSISIGQPAKIKTTKSKLCRPVDLVWMMTKSEVRRRLNVKKVQKAMY